MIPVNNESKSVRKRKTSSSGNRITYYSKKVKFYSFFRHNWNFLWNYVNKRISQSLFETAIRAVVKEINCYLAASRRWQCVTDCGWTTHILWAPRPELRRLYRTDHHCKNEPGAQRMERLPPGRRLALPVGASPQFVVLLTETDMHKKFF